MKLIVNRKEVEFKDDVTLQEVIDSTKLGDKMMGAAVNGSVITICDIKTVKLKDGDKIDIISAMAAG